MSQLQQSDVRNRLLTLLAPEDFLRLAPELERVAHVPRDLIIRPNEPIRHAHFIEEGIVSLIADSAERRIEIGMVGPEGFIGVPLILGTDRTPHIAMVQAELGALRVPAPVLLVALDASPALRSLLGRYAQSLAIQVGQTVHANAELTIEGRLARWILMTRDRLARDELPLTHDLLALMLGVRRPGVTTAVHMLEGAGMIRARRGRITVLDREKLEDIASEAYGLAEAEYERLFPRSL